MDELLTLLWKTVDNQACVKTEMVLSPPPLNSIFEQPNKEEAIIKHKQISTSLMYFLTIVIMVTVRV